jgi:hypothetical protein
VHPHGCKWVPYAPHPAVWGVHVHALRVRAMIMGPIGEAFAPPPRHSCPS